MESLWQTLSFVHSNLVTTLLTMLRMRTPFGWITFLETRYEQHEQLTRHFLMSCFQQIVC
ncbi:hypothetical protein IA69_10885 [Massilia sp. JS1662]|nr:hypothetical protein IA69_10885 [Massilia sp. JS1662]